MTDSYEQLTNILVENETAIAEFFGVTSEAGIRHQLKRLQVMKKNATRGGTTIDGSAIGYALDELSKQKAIAIIDELCERLENILDKEDDDEQSEEEEVETGEIALDEINEQEQNHE